MIKHEEVRGIVNGNEANLNKMDMLENLLSGDYILLAIKQTELSLLNNYITEQEKKDELLTKIKDILALNFSYQEIGIKIKKLFKEELK